MMTALASGAGGAGDEVRGFMIQSRKEIESGYCYSSI